MIAARSIAVAGERIWHSPGCEEVSTHRCHFDASWNVKADTEVVRGIDRMKLAAPIRNRWPPIEIILTSGQVDAANVDLPPRGLFFSKPYDEKHVVTAMKKFA